MIIFIIWLLVLISPILAKLTVACLAKIHLQSVAVVSNLASITPVSSNSLAICKPLVIFIVPVLYTSLLKYNPEAPVINSCPYCSVFLGNLMLSVSIDL